MTFKGKKIVVTGAGGFIGSHLAERLVEEGAQVTALIHYDSRPDRGNLELVAPALRREMRIVSGDVCDPFFVQGLLAGQEIVFHLAALIPIPYSYLAPASYVTTNVIGTLNICEAARRGGVTRLVHTSTSEVYGTALHPTISEDHPLQAQSPYAASKIGADKIAESYYRAMELPVAVARPFNTYGPRQSARAVIPTILSQLLSGVEVLRLGSLKPVRDFLFVQDTVSGFLAVAASDACVGDVTHLGTGRAVTIGEIARIAMQIVGREVPIVEQQERQRPQKSEVMALICDPARAAQRCRWSASISLEEGLKQVAEFIRSHPERFRPEEYAL